MVTEVKGVNKNRILVILIGKCYSWLSQWKINKWWIVFTTVIELIEEITIVIKEISKKKNKRKNKWKVKVFILFILIVGDKLSVEERVEYNNSESSKKCWVLPQE